MDLDRIDSEAVITWVRPKGGDILSWYVSGKSKLSKSEGKLECWSTVYGPGDEVPTSGIYYCVGCNKEITSNHLDKFPPQNHHQHSTEQGKIRWQLNVRTNTKGV